MDAGDTDADDDLPVLTHVLRTSDGRMPSTLMTPIEDDSYVDELGIHHFEEAPLTRQIVIGHEAHHPIDDLDAATVHGNYASFTNTPVADPRQIHRDPFRLSQDTDPSHQHVAESIDHPELVPGTRSEVSLPVTRERTIEFPQPPDTKALAARLRDSIFTDLASRVDVELDARIAQVLHAEIESALAQLQSNLRTHLTEALRDVVARAVGEELARMDRASHDPKPH